MFWPPPPPVIKSPHEVPCLFAANVVIILAEVGGEYGWFLVDSGSPISVLSPQFLAKLQIKPTALHRSAYGFKDDDVLVSTVSIGVVQDGSAEFAVGAYATAPRLRQLLGNPPLDGVLGFNVLRLNCMGLDYAHGKVWNWGPGDEKNAQRTLFRNSAFDVVPIWTHDLAPTANIRIGAANVSAVIDTGSTACSVPASDSGGMVDKLLSQSRQVMLPLGPGSERLALLRDIQIGSGRIVAAPAAVSTGHRVVLAPAILGTRNAVLCDFANGTLEFAKFGQRSGIEAYLQPLSFEGGKNGRIDIVQHGMGISVPVGKGTQIDGIGTLALLAPTADARARLDATARLLEHHGTEVVLTWRSNGGSNRATMAPVTTGREPRPGGQYPLEPNPFDSGPGYYARSSRGAMEFLGSGVTAVMPRGSVAAIVGIGCCPVAGKPSPSRLDGLDQLLLPHIGTAARIPEPKGPLIVEPWPRSAKQTRLAYARSCGPVSPQGTYRCIASDGWRVGATSHGRLTFYPVDAGAYPDGAPSFLLLPPNGPILRLHAYGPMHVPPNYGCVPPPGWTYVPQTGLATGGLLFPRTPRKRAASPARRDT